MVEIIFLVYLVFSNGNLDQAHYYAWHTYDAGPKFLVNRPCEETIQDPAFQSHLRKSLKPGQQGKIMCRSASEVDSLQELAESPALELLPLKEDTRAEQEIVMLEGKLVHRPYDSSRKSQQSYMGQEFFLVKDNGNEVALYPTAKVSRDMLLKQKNKTIRIQARFVDRTPGEDSPISSFPMGPDGGPLKRTGYEVLKLQP